MMDVCGEIRNTSERTGVYEENKTNDDDDDGDIALPPAKIPKRSHDSSETSLCSAGSETHRDSAEHVPSKQCTVCTETFVSKAPLTTVCKFCHLDGHRPCSVCTHVFWARSQLDIPGNHPLICQDCKLKAAEVARVELERNTELERIAEEEANEVANGILMALPFNYTSGWSAKKSIVPVTAPPTVRRLPFKYLSGATPKLKSEMNADGSAAVPPKKKKKAKPAPPKKRKDYVVSKKLEQFFKPS
jgi:hypothetical protein